MIAALAVGATQSAADVNVGFGLGVVEVKAAYVMPPPTPRTRPRPRRIAASGMLSGRLTGFLLSLRDRVVLGCLGPPDAGELVRAERERGDHHEQQPPERSADPEEQVAEPPHVISHEAEGAVRSDLPVLLARVGVALGDEL